ncbi:MAG: hypothetical protein KA052_02470 [Candidatus Pacebacteria bacterium]|nr:hypothetical protein [Candidatus Paceibacterota bacterium]
MSTDEKKPEMEETPDYKKLTQEFEREYVEFSTVVAEEKKKLKKLLEEK